MRNAIVAVLFITVALTSCYSTRSTTKVRKKPKRIILLIGDGMGLTQISTLFLEKDNTNNFKRFRDIGFINTRSGSHKITDSAAGATAFASGVKTYNGAIGVDLDTNSVPNLVDYFSERKYKTGMIATSSITHATPAAFYAHTNHRNNHYDIAQQLLKSDVDFFVGGGRGYFYPFVSDMKLYNWQIDSSACCEFNKEFVYDPEQRYGFLSTTGALPTMKLDRGSYLMHASEGALKYFDKSPFFMMIEGSQIDWGGHANDYEYVVTEMTDFDETVGAMLDFAEQDKNTLVIVTADHETGGLSLGGQNYINKDGNTRQRYNVVAPSFNTGGHTTTLIPVFAYGPGSELFQGVYENTDIYKKIKDLVR